MGGGDVGGHVGECAVEGGEAGGGDALGGQGDDVAACGCQVGFARGRREVVAGAAAIAGIGFDLRWQAGWLARLATSPSLAICTSG